MLVPGNGASKSCIMYQVMVSLCLARAPGPKTPSINDETNPTVHKIIPATCNVNSWEVEMVLERPTLLNAQELFQLPVHITLVAGIL